MAQASVLHSSQFIVHPHITICTMADAAQETMTSSEFEVVGDAAPQVMEAPDQAQPAAEQQGLVSEASLRFGARSWHAYFAWDPAFVFWGRAQPSHVVWIVRLCFFFQFHNCYFFLLGI